MTFAFSFVPVLSFLRELVPLLLNVQVFVTLDIRDFFYSRLFHFLLKKSSRRFRDIYCQNRHVVKGPPNIHGSNTGPVNLVRDRR